MVILLKRRGGGKQANSIRMNRKKGRMKKRREGVGRVRKKEKKEEREKGEKWGEGVEDIFKKEEDDQKECKKIGKKEIQRKKREKEE